MKQLPFLLSIFFLIFSSTTSGKTEIKNESSSVISFNKTFKGKISNKYEVVLKLEATSGIIKGFYFYTSNGIDIKLSGTINDKKSFEMFEFDHNGKKIAKFVGSIINSGITAKWINLSTNKALPVKLMESTLKIDPLPNNIVGTYHLLDEGEIGECSISISILKTKDGYNYNFKTTKRNKNGKIIFYRDTQEGANYIVFKGLSGDDNQGDFEGEFTENEIISQNYGNSMNYYVRISECDRKFLHFKKDN